MQSLALASPRERQQPTPQAASTIGGAWTARSTNGLSAPWHSATQATKTASDDAVNSLRETVKRDAVEQSTLLNNEAQRLLLSFIENGENAAIFLRKSL